MCLSVFCFCFFGGWGRGPFRAYLIFMDGCIISSVDGVIAFIHKEGISIVFDTLLNVANSGEPVKVVYKEWGACSSLTFSF